MGRYLPEVVPLLLATKLLATQMFATLLATQLFAAAEATAIQDPQSQPLPFVIRRGHEVGPARRATLQHGIGTGLHLPVSVDSKQAQQFFDSGMIQLHSQDLLEAERSFREVAALEPNCAMAYVGAALANVSQPRRARWFAEEALLRRPLASGREQLYVDALARFYEANAKTAQALRDSRSDTANIYDIEAPTFGASLEARTRRLLLDLTANVAGQPDDIEGRALLLRQIWLARVQNVLAAAELEPALRTADTHFDAIFARSPRHPAHFYRLQYDVFGNPAAAMRSIPMVGLHAPHAIESWLACGRLLIAHQRPLDAARYFEAAFRTANQRLITQRRMPYELPAHSDAALVHARSLARLGRIRECLDLLRHLADLPRHPTHNRITDPHSLAARTADCVGEICAHYGLNDVLTQWRRENRLAEPPAGATARAAPGRLATLVRQFEAARSVDPSGDPSGQSAPDPRPVLFAEIRRLGGQADHLHPFFHSIQAYAQQNKIAQDWRLPRADLIDWPKDLGALPQPQEHGPATWSPYTPYDWRLPDPAGTWHRSADLRGQPFVLIAYLGFG